MSFQTVSVIGLGYIGLPTAAILAASGKQVIGVDVNREAVNIINSGAIHITEPDLDVLVHSVVKNGALRATTTPEPADAFMIAVPTPFRENHQPDLAYVKAAGLSIATVLRKGNLVVLESTSPVGTTELLAEWMAEARPDLSFPHQAGEDADVAVAYCPERVLPGQVLKELVENDRLIGGLTERCTSLATELYSSFVKGGCVATDCRTAEMAKLTENSFRDVNIAFANELSLICDQLDIDVWKLIRLANRHPRVNILNPGPGVGGHCIAVDPWFIVSRSPEQSRMIRTAREVNDYKPEWILEKMARRISEFSGREGRPPVVCCYGVAFKPNIDDLRESPALEITRKLIEAGTASILVVEPNIRRLPAKLAGARLVGIEEASRDADLHVMLVAHREFATLSASETTRDAMDFCGLFTLA
ncbi:MAG: UDP-N-acetyl-D-mannosamine dehydrogenase [Pseudaminobacter sp.]|nr:UDP-N-acetyl-D-mannosamine dehydrogenase [Pseudaminobacter sp.]